MLRVERFEYVRFGEQLAVVHLRAGLGAASAPPPDAALEVAFDRYRTTSPVRSSALERAPGRRLSRAGLVWVASFAVAREVVEYPAAHFELTAPGFPALALPLPNLGRVTTSRGAGVRARYRPSRPARYRLAAAASVIVVSASTPAVALAAGNTPGRSALVAAGGRSHVHRPSKHLGLLHLPEHAKAHAGKTVHIFSAAPVPAPHHHLRPSGGASALVAPPSSKGRGAPAHHHPTPHQHPPAHQHPAPRAHKHPAPSPHKHPAPSPHKHPVPPAPHRHHPAPAPAPAPAPHRHHPAPAPAPAPHRHHPAPAPAPHRHHPAPAPHRHHPAPVPHRHHPAPAPHRHHPAPAPHRHHPAPPAPEPPVRTAPTTLDSPSVATPGGTAAQRAQAAAFGRLSDLLANGNEPPAYLIPIYKAAGRRYHVPWQVLAAINFIESDYGRNMNTSSAGAIGWMQFMPSTWLEYGVDVHHRGRPNPYDPRDAIFAAARYLAANGARHDLRKAIFAYNHATWYVDEILLKAAGIKAYKHADAGVRLKLAAMRTMTKLLNGKPYIWGGGHGDWTIGPGYDCSGFVSAVLHAAGYLTVPVTTQSLPGQPGILPGPGRFVTIFDRTDAGGSDHVIMDIDGQWWESGGMSAAGVHRIDGISAAYLATFNLTLHPRGL